MSERTSPEGIDFGKLFPDPEKRMLALRLFNTAIKIRGIAEILGLVDQESGVCYKLIFLVPGDDFKARTARADWQEAYERICPTILQKTMLNHPMFFAQVEWDEAKKEESEGKRILPIWKRGQDRVD